MPTKKKKRAKGKGKARKAAKSRNELRNDAARDEVKIVELQMQRLQINNDNDNNHNNDEDALLEEAINLASAEREELEAAARNNEDEVSNECGHGFGPSPKEHVCVAFVDSFLAEIADSYYITGIDVLLAAYEATKIKWAEVWNDPDLMQQVISKLLAYGTKTILEGNDCHARQVAMYASFFEQWRAAIICKTHPTWDWGKLGELSNDTIDKHTLVSFFRKRIPCKCLDKRYKEVKSIVKMGICYNPRCTLPGRKVERSKLLCCAKCRSVYYCSSECQKAAWPLHKERCIAVGVKLRQIKQSLRCREDSLSEYIGLN